MGVFSRNFGRAQTEVSPNSNRSPSSSQGNSAENDDPPAFMMKSLYDDDSIPPEEIDIYNLPTSHKPNYTHHTGRADKSAKKAIAGFCLTRFPCVYWAMPWNYGFKKNFMSDVVAGLTVGAMLVPQSMAYALVAELPPVYGLYTAIFPAFVYPIFGTSRQLSLGPVAIVSLLTATAISNLEDAENADESTNSAYVSLAIALAGYTGAWLTLFGILNLGAVVQFISHPVISAFTSAGAIIIGLSQLKHCLGYDITRSKHLHEIVIDACSKLGDTHYPSLLMAISAFVILWVARKIPYVRRLPVALFIVIVYTFISWAASLEDHGIDVLGTIPSGFPSPDLDGFTRNPADLLMPSLTIALVSFLESIAVAKSLAKKQGYMLQPSQELFGLGVANIVGSLLSCYPCAGSFSRTALNGFLGAKTQYACLLSASCIAVVLLLLAPLFEPLPKPILGPIVIIAVLNLIDFSEPRHLWKLKKLEFVVWFVTFMCTLFWGVEEGILVGVAVSLLAVILRSARPQVAVLGRVPGTGIYARKGKDTDLETLPGVLILRFQGNLFFGNTNYFNEHLAKMMERAGNQLKCVILDMSGINDVDTSGLSVLHETAVDLKKNNIAITFAHVRENLRDLMIRAKMSDVESFHTVDEAVTGAQNLADRMAKEAAEAKAAEEETNKEDDDQVGDLEEGSPKQDVAQSQISFDTAYAASSTSLPSDVGDNRAKPARVTNGTSERSA